MRGGTQVLSGTPISLCHLSLRVLAAGALPRPSGREQFRRRWLADAVLPAVPPLLPRHQVRFYRAARLLRTPRVKIPNPTLSA